MKRRHTLTTGILCFVGITSTALAGEKPNIVIILTDDQGYADVSYNPHSPPEVSTPNIDALARSSVICTHGYTSGHVCSPTRAGLMTGRYQQRFGHEANTPPPDKGMDLNQETMADALKSHGYRTGLVGKWHLGNADRFYPTERGFDSFYGLREGSRSYFFNPDREDKPSSTKRIEKNGATVEYSDPHIPKFKKMRNHDFNFSSKVLSPESLHEYDAVIVCTDHDEFDYEMIIKNSDVVIDTRGVYKRGIFADQYYPNLYLS